MATTRVSDDYNLFNSDRCHILKNHHWSVLDLYVSWGCSAQYLASGAVMQSCTFCEVFFGGSSLDSGRVAPGSHFFELRTLPGGGFASLAFLNLFF